jgi:hypothetical protein
MHLAELFTTCEQLQQAGKADEALHTYKSWLEISNDPSRFMGWFNYGSLLQAAGNTPAAEMVEFKARLKMTAQNFVGLEKASTPSH